jgi:putative protein-disulfide isomerase
MSARLVYVMDPLCSWCWGFAPVMAALASRAAEAGVGCDLVVGGLRRQQNPLSAADRVKILGHWQAVNARTGQSFDFNAGMPAGFVYDTAPACRALVTARQLEPQRLWDYLRAIQRAFYCEGRDLSLSHELVALAEQAGLPRAAFAKAFDGAQAEQQTLGDFDWVERLGIAGFPTLLAESGGQLALLTNGYRPLEELAPLLERWLQHNAS